MQINITTDINVNYDDVADFVYWVLKNEEFKSDQEFRPRVVMSDKFNLCGRVTKYRKSIRIIIMKKNKEVNYE